MVNPTPPAPQPGVSPAGSGQTLALVANALISGQIPMPMAANSSQGSPQIFLGNSVREVPGSPASRTRRVTRPSSYAVPERIGMEDWVRRWYQLSPEERADYTERFAQAGMNVSNPMQARSAWISLGELAAEQYGNGTGDEITPDALLDTLIADAPIAEDEDEALTPVEQRDARAKIRTELERFAYQNGLDLTKETFRRHVTDILNEDTTLPTLQKAYMKQLTAAYPAFAEQIEAGFTLREIASPYAQEMSRILEIPEDAIDFRDPAMAKALQAVGQDGKPTYVPLWQFREELKKDERWQYTDNAWNEMGDMAMGIARMFGLTA